MPRDVIVNQLIGVVIWAGRKGTQRQNQGDQVFPAGNNNWKYATTSSVLEVCGAGQVGLLKLPSPMDLFFLNCSSPTNRFV